MARTNAPLPEVLNREQRLKLSQVSILVGRGRTGIYKLINEGRLPEPERDGPRCSRWRAGDVLDALAALREAQPVASAPTAPTAPATPLADTQVKRGPGRPRKTLAAGAPA